METKSIIIEGKVARYRMRKLEPPQPPKPRKVAATWAAIADNQLPTLGTSQLVAVGDRCLHSLVPLGTSQLEVLRQGTDKRMVSEISRKLCGYRQQDKNHTNGVPIGLQSTIDLLVASELKCCYCRQEVLVLYEMVREKQQWTLDRIDNSLGHTADNVAIACLECNLKRRCVDNDLFRFNKQLVVCKSGHGTSGSRALCKSEEK